MYILYILGAVKIHQTFKVFLMIIIELHWEQPKISKYVCRQLCKSYSNWKLMLAQYQPYWDDCPSNLLRHPVLRVIELGAHFEKIWYMNRYQIFSQVGSPWEQNDIITTYLV